MDQEQALRTRREDDRPTFPPRPQMVPLSPEEALRLLAGAPFGRIVFTEHALPAVRLVNHVLVDGRILIRTHKGAALTLAVPAGGTDGTVVAYETDDIDVRTRSGWSVSVTGYARLIASGSDGEGGGFDLAGQTTLPAPWFDAEMTHLVVIEPEIVTGMRLLGGS